MNTPVRMSKVATALVCALLVGTLVLIVGRSTLARESAVARERLLMRVVPSAERAYSYGSRHFNAEHPEMYDINQAEYFFGRAVILDPELPFVYHQLARVAFLRGDFNNALRMINRELEINAADSPSSYYVRALIEGYMGRYDDAARDYESFLQLYPHSWAALNDYAWVLLKAENFRAAARVTQRGLDAFPGNPWLLSSHAIALYELHDYAEALEAAKMASVAGEEVTEAAWLRAYPGNDPRVAREGISTFKKAVAENMHSIELALSSSTVQ